MSRFTALSCSLLLLALTAVSVPCQAQFNFPKIDPADILNKVLHKNAPQVKPNVPANQIAPPANDNFANREQLVGTDVRAQADNRGATIEPGEPTHIPGQTNRHTVWWSWTAPDTGRVTIDTLGSVSKADITSLTFYVGGTLDSLIPVARHAAGTSDYKVVFPVESGRIYQIASNAPWGQGNYDGQIGFNLHFTPNALPPPVIGRDNFADRPSLKGSEAMAVADNLQMSTEFNEPIHIPGKENRHTVWWTWTAPDTGRITIDTLGGVSKADITALTFYVGDTLDSLIPVARHAAGTNDYKLVLPVDVGRIYQIVSNAPWGQGNYDGQIGFNLHFTKTTLPPPVIGRDNFADRPSLKGNEAMAVANNEQTTLETDEPIHTPGTENLHTVWWTWTAPATGRVTVDTLKLGIIPTALTFYQGDALANLVPVVRTRGLNEGDKLVLPVASGQTYQIVSNGGSGQIGFNLHFTPNALPPPVIGRDNFVDRATLKGSEAMAVANNEQATIETDEPDHEPGQKDARTVWWTWTAPATGRVILDTLGGVSSTANTALVVYQGEALANLAPTAHLSGSTTGYMLAFPVKAKQTYQIVANGVDGNCVGQMGFNLHFHPLHPKPQIKP